MTTHAMDTAVDHESRAGRLDRVMRRFDGPMAVLAIAVVPAILVEQRATSPAVQTGALVVNWIIWLAFCGEFGVDLVLAPRA